MYTYIDQNDSKVHGDVHVITVTLLYTVYVTLSYCVMYSAQATSYDVMSSNMMSLQVSKVA